ncbi:hypothetical protein E3226_011910 (plasmid) [Legionella geestiana]|uniref:hypothetical protein n=1 Tax=Legionella geestiana TaxID=45065 RepID=UPI001091A717|nr:hypothetical protein [Legionella geestiana]QDQ41186.1 hypothetical protein E3226_011910 [Legionella geestiana]
MLHSFFNKIDEIICRYLGIIGDEIDRPRSMRVIRNKIIVYKNAPFQRYKSVESWRDFNNCNLQHESDVNKQKIGIAAGNLIAKNLIISFVDIDVKGN